MPAKTGTSSVVGKLGANVRKAFDKAKTNEVVLGGGGDLPEGIEMGVARLTMCKFDKYKNGPNAGQWFFMARASVVAPDQHNGISLLGLSTQIGPEPVCDTPNAQGKKKTLQDHVDWITNQLKLIYGNNEEFESLDLSEDGVLESVAQTLQEEKPYIRFRTWKGKKLKETDPEPRVQHDWRGRTTFNGEIADDVVDNQDVDEVVDEVAKDEPAADEPEAEADEVDIDALVESADGGDEDAQEKLQNMALEAGVSEDDIQGAKNWGEVAGLIRLGNEAESEAESESEAEKTPEKGNVYKVKLIDPKTKKKGKAVECTVTAVQEKNRTVHLKNNVTAKPYADLKTKKPIAVSWDDLESAD